MRSMRWSSMLMVAALAACGGGEGGESEAVEMEAPPAEAPAPSAPAMTAELPEGVTAEMVQAGEGLFNGGVCAACHGPNAAGIQGLGPNLADQTFLHGDGSFDSLVTIINEGISQPLAGGAPMPPKGGNAGLTDQQVREIAAYVYALSHS